MAIVVLSSLALKGVLDQARARFEQALRERLELQFDATQAILPRLAAGARADLLVLTTEAMHELEKSKSVKEVRALGSSGVGVAVRAGAPRPDIGSLEAFKSALLAARSVAHSKSGASGMYFAQLLEKWNLPLKERVVVEKGPVGLVVAAGDAEIGVQLLCELAPVAGIDIVGPFPDAIQKMFYFSAGISAGAANAQGALALMELLVSRAATSPMLSPRRPTS
jgi:molybdate transport system substrate-binding protein